MAIIPTYFLICLLQYVSCFHKLSEEHTREIVKLMLAGVTKRLEERDIHIELSEAAVDAIADAGFDPVYGARPLKRYMQSQLETMLAREIVSGGILPGQRGVVNVDGDGKLVCRTEALAVR